RRGAPQRVPRPAGRHVQGSGRRQGHRLHLQAADGATGRGVGRRKAAAAGVDQPVVECAEVHPQGQRAVRGALPQPG
ncbi:hypothetical protein ABTC99_21045, partial [Acinetobacter baumannii]